MSSSYMLKTDSASTRPCGGWQCSDDDSDGDDDDGGEHDDGDDDGGDDDLLFSLPVPQSNLPLRITGEELVVGPVNLRGLKLQGKNNW